METLDDILKPLPGYGLLSESMKNAALAGSLIPDSFGIWPGQPGYENTYDVYFAAINLIGYLRAQPVIRSSSSEGTSVSVDAPNWDALLSYFRSQSPVVQTSGNPVLQLVEIPDPPHVRRVSMEDKGLRYGDIDGIHG